ncbi:MAG TPA: hypothetical protein VGO18_19105, partial [Steroidobacteraceae bacterium]|nr:hypothetical protein [Steroidobacteraceae bacterium]
MDALRRGAASLVVVLSACGAQNAPVDAARLTAADGDTANWLTYGRTYDEQRFSPLKQINTQSVRQLKLAWHYDLDAAH